MPDGFKDKTPEEMEEIGRRISEGVKKRYANLTLGQAIQENENKSKAVQAYWDAVSPEEKERRLSTSFLSPEAKVRSTKSLRKYFAGTTDEERKRQARISFDSPEAIRAKRETFKHMSPEQIKEWTARSFLSNQAHLNSAKNNPKLPTPEEVLLDSILNSHFPRLFGYNGKGNLDICVGGRIPDFVRLDNTPQVISLFGEAFTSFSRLVDEVLHYKTYGYECLILWNHECYNEAELLTELGTFIDSEGRSEL